MRIKIIFAVLALLLTCTTIHALTCSDETISSGTFDKISVPAGKSCEILSDVVIIKNFEAKGAKDIKIHGSMIGGDVIIKNSVGSVITVDGAAKINGKVLIADNTMTGDINLLNGIVGNTVFNEFSLSVGGKVKMSNNTAKGVVVYGVAIGGDLSVLNNAAIERVHTDCNGINGSLTFSNNSSSSSDGFLSVLLNCPGIQPGPAGFVKGGNAILNNNHTTGHIDFSYIATPKNLIVNGNSSDKFVSVAAETVGGNMICKGNNPDPDFFHFGDPPSVVSGKMLCND